MTSAARFCPECGKEVGDKAKYCANCGTRLPISPSAALAAGAVYEAPRGPCILFRTNAGAYNTGAVGRLIAKVQGKPLSDVTRQLNTSRGILADRMDADAAARIMPELQELGVECIAVPVDRVALLPEAAYLRDGKFSDAGLKCEAVTWEGWQWVERSWSDVVLASCTVLVTERVRVLDLGGGILRRKEQVLTDVFRKTILDLFVKSPWGQVRVEEAIPQQEAIPKPPPTHPIAYLRTLAKQLLQVTPPVNVNEGVRLLAAASSETAFSPVTFYTRRDIDQYSLWLVELVDHGLPVPH